MISINGLSKFFGSKAAVNGLSLSIADGEHLALLGPSGSGKTTLLRMINRLIDPTYGIICINGKDISTQPAHLLRQSIGFVLQANSLFPHYTVEQNIGIVPLLLKWKRTEIGDRITDLLKKMQLPDSYRSRYPHQLSGGEAQRVNLARALAGNPPILLMDEPFSALDTITRISLRYLFANLEELKNKTIVVVTHDVQEAFEIGHTVLLMHSGMVIQKGKPAELLYHPASDYVRRFFTANYPALVLSATPSDERGCIDWKAVYKTWTEQQKILSYE